MKAVNFTIKMSAILLIIANLSFAGDFIRDHKVFNDINELKIEGVCGDWTISTHTSNEIIVDLKYSENLKNYFTGEMTQRGSKLKLEEDFDRGIHTKTVILWTIKVPEKMDVSYSTASGDLKLSGINGDIDCSSASGDFTLSDLSGKCDISTASGDIEGKNIKSDMEFSTASGDVRLKKVSGKFDISTASGDIDAEKSSGRFNFSTASGDIDVSDVNAGLNFSCASGDISCENILITKPSSFSTASGDVSLCLQKSAGYDLDLSTASGDITLDYNGNAIEGRVEMTARKRKGRIVSPYSFDKVDEYEKNGRTYERKSFTKGTENIQIVMETSSGTLRLRK